MIVQLRTLLFSLVFASLATTATGDEAQDAQVEQGVAAYDEGDYQRAKDILLPLAEAGHPKAMNMVGLMTKFGNGFTPNPEVACDWYEKSATAGYSSAMYNMSICYDGFGRPNDPERHKFWLLRAADVGHVPAMINLSAFDPSKGEEYLKWHRLAIDHGSTFAKVSLWLDGFKDEVPDITFGEIVCVSWNIILLDGGFRECD